MITTMEFQFFTILVLLFLGYIDAEGSGSRLDNLKTVDDYMNICIDGKYHKKTPGPEEGLTKMVNCF